MFCIGNFSAYNGGVPYKGKYSLWSTFYTSLSKPIHSNRKLSNIQTHTDTFKACCNCKH